MNLVSMIRREDFFDLHIENFSDLERQWQAGIVLLCLNGIDRLSRHLQFFSQDSLRPASLCAQFA